MVMHPYIPDLRIDCISMGIREIINIYIYIYIYIYGAKGPGPLVRMSEGVQGLQGAMGKDDGDAPPCGSIWEQSMGRGGPRGPEATTRTRRMLQRAEVQTWAETLGARDGWT